MRIGVDVGGTKIEAALVDTKGEILTRQRIPTPQNDYGAAIQAIADLTLKIEEKAGEPCTVGMGIPGAISPKTGLVKNAPNAPFNGHRLDKDLEVLLNRQAPMMNDANCFALSEATDGAAAGAQIVFGVILGTGCGGGIVINGEPLVGANAISGEWGHNPLPWTHDDERPGPRCGCGKTGCIETYLSGPGFEARHFDATGQHISAEIIVARAGDGDTACLASLAQYESRLARALSSIINVLDPDIIVLGGGMSNIDRLYSNVPQLWSQWIFSDHVSTRLVPPKFGDSSGVRGAAWLWPSDTAPISAPKAG
ncbi:MAG: ROK family protein [Alphaproteobacteria bacterium]|jgi:fructokinase